jgi:hypothetical protein
MTDKLTKVNCNLKDCIYYEPNSNYTFMALCKHPDVLLHKTDKRCPLYRVNWVKKMEVLSQISKQRNNHE